MVACAFFRNKLGMDGGRHQRHAPYNIAQHDGHDEMRQTVTNGNSAGQYIIEDRDCSSYDMQKNVFRGRLLLSVRAR